MTLALSVTATASADTIYPTNANTFAGDTQNWTDADHTCGLTLGPLSLPLGAISPLVCTVENSYDTSNGHPPGSIKTQYTAVAGLLGLLTGTGTWQSPPFTITGTPTGATFSLERKGDVAGLINIGGNVNYNVTLVDTSKPVTDTTRTTTLVSNPSVGSDGSWINDPGSKVVAVTAGHSYVLRITSTMTTSFLQAALNPVSINFDNIKLQVADGTGDGVSPAGAATLAPSNLSATAATLNGAVTPYSNAAYYSFEYGLNADLSGATLTARQSAGAGSGPVEESAALTGLEACKTYYYRVRAANVKNFAPANGDPQTDITKDTLGSIVSFDTWCAPDAHTLDAAPVTATTASLNGRINPRGPETTYHYEIGETTGYGYNTPDRSAGGGMENKGPLSEPVSGLKPTTTYHFRIVAANTLGTTVGEDKTFTTPAQSGPGPAGPAGPKGPASVVSNSNTTLANGDARALLIIRSKIARVGLLGQRAGQIRMPIFCKKEVGRSCAGTVKIRTRVKINPSSLGRKKTPRLVTLATFPYQLAAGKKGYAIATIQPEKLRLMQRVKSVKVNLSIQVTDANNNRQTIVQPGTFVAQRTV